MKVDAEAKQAIFKTGQWATFYLGPDRYAIPVEEVQEVLMYQPLTPVPLAAAEIAGLLNLRGAIMPAIDLNVRAQGVSRVERENQKLLVLKTIEGPLSVLVDDIGDVVELRSEEWRALPDTLNGPMRAVLSGLYAQKDHLLLGLKVNALCSDGE